VSLTRRTIASLSWTGTGQVAGEVVRFVLVAVLARLLSPRAFGLVGMSTVVTGFALMFSNLGLSEGLIQKKDLSHREQSSVFWFQVVLGCVIGGIVFAVAPAAAIFFKEPILKGLIRLACLSFLINPVSAVHATMLRKEMRFKETVVIGILRKAAGGAAGIALAVTGMGVWSLVIGELTGALFAVLLYWTAWKWRPSLVLSFREIRELLRFGVNLAGFNIFNYFASNLDYILVARFFGAEALGCYRLAYNIMLMPLMRISSVVGQVMFPALARVKGEMARMQQGYTVAVKYISIAAFPAMLGLMVVSREFILSIYGTNWEAAWPLLQAFCVLGALKAVANPTGWIYTSMGRSGLLFAWGVGEAAVRITGLLIGARFGLQGMVWGLLAAGLVAAYPCQAIPLSLIKMKVSRLLKALRAPAISSLLMVAAVMAVRMGLLRLAFGDQVVLAACIATGVAAYAGAMAWLDRDSGRAAVQYLRLLLPAPRQS
jgi:PST family polysaccharide transporter